MRFDLFIGIVLTLWTITANASPAPKPARGIWFWQEGSSPYGSTAIVGDPLKETQTINFLKTHGITRVYGSYGNRPSDPAEEGIIAAWNAKLHAEGIESHFLVANNTYIFPEKHGNMTTRITNNLINFNNDILRLPEEKFDALHFDVEPQGLSGPQVADLPGRFAWSTLSDAQKRDYVVMLFEMYGVARTHITPSLGVGFPIWGDLPIWFDSLTSSVGWVDASDRDLWYGYAGSQLDGIVMMAFAQSSLSGIVNGTNWEFTNLPGTAIRVALRSTFGTGPEDDWLTLGDFSAMRDLVEDEFGLANAIDIQDYRDYREAHLFLPAVAVSASLFLPPGFSDIFVEVDALPQFVYFVQISADLCRWRSAHSFEVQKAGMERVRMSLGGSPRGFYQVMRYPLPPPQK